VEKEEKEKKDEKYIYIYIYLFIDIYIYIYICIRRPLQGRLPKSLVRGHTKRGRDTFSEKEE